MKNILALLISSSLLVCGVSAEAAAKPHGAQHAKAAKHHAAKATAKKPRKAAAKKHASAGKHGVSKVHAKAAHRAKVR